MSEKFIKDLKAAVQGEIRSDPVSRRVYSVDASIYEVEPLAILQPLNEEEVATALQVAAQHNIAVTARGAATGITGGCLGSGLILDLSRHLTAIKTINLEEQYVICEPGVIQDDLNRSLSSSGFRLGPDTSTGDRATLGGMLANNSAGARSLHFGSMVDHILGLDLLLANGEKFTHQKAIVKALEWVRDSYGQEIAAHFPRLPRRVSGYNLTALLESPFSLGKLIAGSEGTLGIATSLKLRIVPNLKKTTLCVVPFPALLSCMEVVGSMLDFQPLALEMIDEQIIRLGRASPSLKNSLAWLQGDPPVLAIAEFVEERSALSFQQKWGGTILTESPSISAVWQLRKAGLGLLLSRRTYSRAIAFIEDIAVPPQHLSLFMEKFQQILAQAGKQAGIYGHIGAGCLHIRPYFDLRDPSESAKMRIMILEVCDLVLSLGGTMSGEHGDGLVRSWLNEKLFGKNLYKAFIEIKKAFDPDNRLNPGKIVHGPPLEENLRFTPPIKKMATFLDFTPEGGIELAADLCNGNGLCRKREKIMCPSFQVTHDEYDTTRARAQALRGLIHGQLDTKNWHEIHHVLDLCVECKGCKTECPSQVDMAKMKAEFLYQYQEKYGYTLRSKLFGHIGQLANKASLLPQLSNFLSQTSLAKWLLHKAGFTDKRPLPLLPRQRFSNWVAQRSPSLQSKKVLLFNDTYTEYLEPHIGIAAFKVLESLGYQVIVPAWSCCGRPLVSKGLLQQARIQAQKTFLALLPFLEQGIPVVGLEPSCIFTLSDDYAGLISDDRLKNCLNFDTFVAAHKLPLQPLAQEIFVHGHCHQKALIGMKDTQQILQTIPQSTAHLIDSGCCGMAGSFGYEKEHYDFSMQIAELKLFPALRKSRPESILLANGFSCRTQITQGTDRKPLHLAELLASLLPKPSFDR